MPAAHEAFAIRQERKGAVDEAIGGTPFDRPYDPIPILEVEDRSVVNLRRRAVARRQREAAQLAHRANEVISGHWFRLSELARTGGQLVLKLKLASAIWAVRPIRAGIGIAPGDMGTVAADPHRP